jgi:hypothetical protein
MDEHVQRVRAQAPRRARPVITLTVSGPAVRPFEIDVYRGRYGHEQKIARIGGWPGTLRVDHLFEAGEWVSFDLGHFPGKLTRLVTLIEWE